MKVITEDYLTKQELSKIERKDILNVKKGKSPNSKFFVRFFRELK